jgi:glycosyltransferase involved in cell wall biosynthesis
MRITLIIGTLENTGGAERSLSLLANAWTAMGRDVSLITFDRNHAPAYPLSPAIKCRHLDIYEHPRGFLNRTRQIIWRTGVLRQAIQESQPDIVIAFTAEPNIRAVLAARSLKIPVVISERTDPCLHDIGWKWSLPRRLTYPFADILVCQTVSSLARFQKMMKVKGRIIPNLIAAPPLTRSGILMQSARTQRVVIAMGRLEKQKGFDILLKAFALVAPHHPHWSLKILGHGSLKDDLQNLAEYLAISSKVQFAGVHNDPFADLRQADLFVLSSRFEGFPNALCEAMACGLPAISFDCPSGPSDIIRNGKDGILVPAEDTTALASAMNDLMTNETRREQISMRAPEVLQRFSAPRILSLWDDVLNDLVPWTPVRPFRSKETAVSTDELCDESRHSRL